MCVAVAKSIGLEVRRESSSSNSGSRDLCQHCIGYLNLKKKLKKINFSSSAFHKNEKAYLMVELNCKKALIPLYVQFVAFLN